VTVFTALFVPPTLREAVSDQAWLDAMLEAERALANAEAKAGVIPADAAAAIAERCNGELFDTESLAAQGRAAGNLVEPLVRVLREAVGGEAAQFVHWGATSQDVMDTASMLVARRGLGLILHELDQAATGSAALARAYRTTPMAARTLLQQAVPTTFGFKAAGWLVAILDARRGLVRLRDDGLAAQLGGAAGTLAALGEHGPAVLRLYAQELGLAEPGLPWHTNRVRIAELGSGLEIAAGVLAKIGLDLALLAQTEVDEVREAADGPSSTMPQKRNPVGAMRARACARLVNGYASVLSESLASEHERAIGAWQAEWEALSGSLAYTGGGAAAIGKALDGLEVDVARMRQNLDLTGGLIMAERLSFLLAARIGSSKAHELVSTAIRRATTSGRSLRDELDAEEQPVLSEQELDEALDPETYLGSAETFVDRALERYEREGNE
jgi:3-carboxy-cis,cis-muconate cycloisomerase